MLLTSEDTALEPCSTAATFPSKMGYHVMSLEGPRLPPAPILGDKWQSSPGIRVLGIEPKRKITIFSVSTHQPPRPVQSVLSLRVISIPWRNIVRIPLLRFPEHRLYVSEFFVADVTL